MTLATLSDVLKPAEKNRSAIAGLVVLGWEDAIAFTEAAEEVGCPVILQAGPGCRRHTPLSVLGKMFTYLAERASVPVVCHLDHAHTFEECSEAIDCGFTSLMIDGSMLPLDDNIALTARVKGLAKPHKLSVEGEIGAVGYAGGAASAMTDPEEAARFERETGIDALAISIGNVHLQTEHAAMIDWTRLADIQSLTRAPLVLHGGSGIPPSVRRDLARETRVKKFNIGTELRLGFGNALRDYLATHPAEFDRLRILCAPIAPMKNIAMEIMRNLQA
jgi:fructose-bisphosphate aldolase class II